MSETREEEGSAPSLVALRSGVASGQFERSVREVRAAEAQSVPLANQAGQDELPSGGSTQPAVEYPSLFRRLFHCIARAFHPITSRLIRRLEAYISRAVEASPAVQHQTLLLRDIRSFLEHIRWELTHSLEMHDFANNASMRLQRQEEQLVGLRNLAIANMQALVALAEHQREPEARGDGAAASAGKTPAPPKMRSSAFAEALADAGRELAPERESLVEEIRKVRDDLFEQRQLTEGILRSRIVPLGEEVLLRTSFGWLLVPKDDHAIITTMGELGDALEPGTVHVIRSILRSGDLAVDVGANVGGLLLPMAGCVGQEGALIACEPSPTCMQALRKTAVLNGLGPSLVLHQVAVGSADGVATLYLGSNSSLNSIVALPGATGTIEVQIRRLDDIVPADRRPSLVKIDVEGLELEVLRGMRHILDRSPDIALIAEFGPTHLARNGISPADWIAEFESFGFTLFVIDEKDGTLTKASTESLQDVYSSNILMVRQDITGWPQLRVAS